jgi:hypothetical protein
MERLKLLTSSSYLGQSYLRPLAYEVLWNIPSAHPNTAEVPDKVSHFNLIRQL